MTQTKLTLAALSYTMAGVRGIYDERFDVAMAEFRLLAPEDRAEAARLLFQAGLMVQSLNTPTSTPERDEPGFCTTMVVGSE